MPLQTQKCVYILRLGLIVEGTFVEEKSIFPGDGFVTVTDGKLVVEQGPSDKSFFHFGRTELVLWIHSSMEGWVTTAEGVKDFKVIQTNLQVPSLSMPGCRLYRLESNACGKLVLSTGEEVLFQLVERASVTKRVKKPQLKLSLSRKGEFVERDCLVKEEDAVTFTPFGILCGPEIPEERMLISEHSQELDARAILLRPGMSAKIRMNGCLASIECRLDNASRIEGEIEGYPLLLSPEACGEIQVGDDLLAFDYKEVEVDERVRMEAEAPSSTTATPDAKPTSPSPSPPSN